MRHPVLYGDQRGERLGAGYRLRHRRQHRFGQLAGRVSEQESEPNAFQKGISRVSMLLIRFMLVMAPVVLLINGYTKRRLVGSGAVRAVGGGRPDAGDVADDRHLDAGARGGEAVKTKGDRQTPRRHSKTLARWISSAPIKTGTLTRG